MDYEANDGSNDEKLKKLKTINSKEPFSLKVSNKPPTTKRIAYTGRAIISDKSSKKESRKINTIKNKLIQQ